MSGRSTHVPIGAELRDRAAAVRIVDRRPVGGLGSVQPEVRDAGSDEPDPRDVDRRRVVPVVPREARRGSAVRGARLPGLAGVHVAVEPKK